MPNDESRRTVAQLSARNVEIARQLERLSSGRSNDETRARDAALRKEFDSNEATIKRLTQELHDRG